MDKRIATHESLLRHDVSLMSLTHPNDGLKYTLNMVDEYGTASWAHGKGGHIINLYDFTGTFDILPDLVARKCSVNSIKRKFYLYALAMLTHETKGHGALSSRDLPALGAFCGSIGLNPEVLNIAEDARIESALSAKRPGNTKSKGEWIDHDGKPVWIPKTSHGGDYGWRKAYWHRYNRLPRVYESPQCLFNAFVWGERIRGLEDKIGKEFWAQVALHDGEMPIATWGEKFRHKPRKAYIWVKKFFLLCRRWRKYRTTEALKPLLEQWAKTFPAYMGFHTGRVDVMINVIEGGKSLKFPDGSDVNWDDLMVNPKEGLAGSPPIPPPCEEESEEKTGGGSTKAKKPSEDEDPEDPKDEELKQHDKSSESLDPDKSKTSHDKQTEGMGDGGRSELESDTHTVDAPISINLPGWMTDFVKRDSDFGSGNEKLPADFF